MDTFAVKFNAQGGLAYSRLVGGTDVEAGFSIDVLSGSAYVVGETFSADFPANGYAGGRDAFVIKLDPAGAIISSFSKLISGSQDERATSVEVNANGEVFIAGWTNSINLPVTEGSFQGGIYDAFLFKLEQQRCHDLWHLPGRRGLG